MKKSILIRATIMSLFMSIAIQGTGQLNEDSTPPSKASGSQNFEITNTRSSLNESGYTTAMMDDLFGEENMYFPTNKEELSTTIYIVNLLISNDQYAESQKSTLVEMANNAYATYEKSSTQKE